jgi:hypothetical protein
MTDGRAYRPDGGTPGGDGASEPAVRTNPDPNGAEGSSDEGPEPTDRGGGEDGAADAPADGDATAGDTPQGFPDADEALSDATVAAAAGGGTITLALVARLGLGVEVDFFVVMLPLLVYPAYKLAGRVGSFLPEEGVRAWVLVAAGVTLATLAWIVWG